MHHDNPDDVRTYAARCKEYYQWINTLDYVTGAYTFLWCNTDSGFTDFTWERMPGMAEMMSEPWDRLAELPGYEQAPQPDPELPAEPVEEPKGETMTEEQKKILAALDDAWGVLNKLEAAADQAKADTARIRAQIISIKEAAGLNAPGPLA
jgi:hypothetical protein